MVGESTHHGKLDREAIASLYQQVEYLVFPSQGESFGLPIIEAIEMGCKVIAVDLPYVHAICEPSIVFDAGSESSLSQALARTLRNDIPNTMAKIRNCMPELLRLLK